jgi:hypothetical protein
MSDTLNMDFVKLDTLQMYELYIIMNTAAYEMGKSESRKVSPQEALKEIERLKQFPMTSTEAKNLLPLLDEYYQDLSEAFDDDWENEEYTMREETIKTIIAELQRISQL